MARLTVADITDELIKPVVTQEDLDAADDYLTDLAASMDYTLANIPNPLPYKVKRLAIMFVCREICARKSGGANGAAFRGQESGDKWTAKLPYFANEFRALEGQITPEVLIGEKTSKSIGTITLERS